MVALTYDAGTAGTLKTAPTAARVTEAAPGKSFLKRLYDAMIEARMQQAHREIRMHMHLLPYTPLSDSEQEKSPRGGW